MATLDSLTGLFSRRGFHAEFERIWQLGDRQQMQTGLMIMDIDHFKVLNDTYGHPVGDQILVEAAQMIGTNVRAGDVVCRYGGDEMVVILPLTGPDELLRVAERIRNSFVRHVFCQGTHDLKVTVSVGAACGSGGIQEAQLTMTHADRALYRVKQMGRNGVHFWEGQSSDSMIPPHKTTPPTQLSSSGSNTRGRILVVDDDEAVSGYLKIFLHGEHFQVYVASNGAQARNIVDQERGRIDVAMVDLGLGAENGLEVLQNLREVDDTLVGLVMTGNATSTNAASALRSGASDFIEKPLDDSALAEAIQRAMRYRQLLQENRRYQRHLEDMVAERSAALSRTLTQVKQSYRNTLEVLAGILDVRESQTGEHCKRVAASARILAREMGMTEADIEIVGDGGLLHDIGKIAIPDAILLKPGPLTESEWAVVRNHSQLGYNIVSACPPLEQASEIVLSHQERFDGRGYPRALKGTEICLGARVFAVVDAYDAMRFDRPYSPSQSVEKATAEIVAQRGLQFDPDVVDAFLRCQPRMEQVIALTETSRK
jgi:diguanylate cyclase (GGDEF)-like protein/putative nucleotidyltransferase with HDIG domain